MQKGDALTLTIDRPAAGGRMIARHDGKVVFVADAIPGETVEALVEKVQRDTAWARTTRIVEPSADRIVPAGDPRCGGCNLAHVRPARQLELKREILADALRRLGQVTLDRPVDIEASPDEGYRLRAHLHVADGRLGFFREGTHQVCDAAQTRQLRADTLDALCRLLTACERRQPGAVSSIVVSENRDANERAAHLELAAFGRKGGLASLDPLPGFVGVSCAPADQPHSRILWGTPRVTDTLTATTASGATPTTTLTRHARAFFQGNRYLLQPLLDHVLAQMSQGAIVDLYAGVGLFSVAACAAEFGPVVAVEGDPIAVGDLRHNAAPYASALDVRAQSVEDFTRSPRVRVRPSTVIVDPPRTGLSRAALSGVLAIGAPRLVYVSCDVATLARDTRILREAGYQLASVRAFDLFPNTAHVETVIAFDR